MLAQDPPAPPVHCLDARRRFRETALTLRARARQDGVELSRVRVFDAYLVGSPAPRRSALVLGRVYAGGRLDRVFAGVAVPARVLAAAPAAEADCWALQAAAEAHLRRLALAGARIDAPLGWIALPRLLGERAFVERWQAAGFADCWPRTAWAGLPRTLDADFFDLLRHFLRRYACALPPRYAWRGGAWERLPGAAPWPREAALGGIAR